MISLLFGVFTQSGATADAKRRTAELKRYPIFDCCDPYCLGIKTPDLDHRNDEYFKMKSAIDYFSVPYLFAGQTIRD